jgi:hypothetical protein
MVNEVKGLGKYNVDDMKSRMALDQQRIDKMRQGDFGDVHGRAEERGRDADSINNESQRIGRNSRPVTGGLGLNDANRITDPKYSTAYDIIGKKEHEIAALQAKVRHLENDVATRGGDAKMHNP